VTEQESPASVKAPAEPILFRSSSVVGVDVDERIIEFVAAPYDEEAMVMWRGEAWREVFMRGAWDGIEKRQNWVKANREHDKKLTVGKVVNWWPSRTEGLVGAAKIAETTDGDNTLALAREDCLGASVGYAALARDVDLDKRTRPGLRRVKRAFMDHLSFVADPAYASAGVLSVRSAGALSADEIRTMERMQRPVETPALDELVTWMRSRKG
jgi:HK97 family phage prohead protease